MTHVTFEFGQSGESQVFVTTQDVRNSDHGNGTIAEGERVFFTLSDEDESVTLSYESGEPTNGSEYVRFDGIVSAEEFANRVGLVEV